MQSVFTKVKLAFVGVFLVASGLIWAYHAAYVWPAQRCEAAGAWWYAPERACGVPMKITDILGNSEPTPGAPVAKAPAVPASPPVSGGKS